VCSCSVRTRSEGSLSCALSFGVHFSFFVFFYFYCYGDNRDLHSFPTRRSSDLYGSSHIGATAKDISNVVTDAASGVVDIFHGIDKAVADTWNNFWKDGKADGIGSNLSRK